MMGFVGWGVEDVSRESGVHERTLRRWHDRGYVRASNRKGRSRRYTRRDVILVKLFNAYLEEGLSHRKAKQALEATKRVFEQELIRV